MRRSHYVFPLAVSLVLLAGCAAIVRPPATVESLTADAVLQDRAQREVLDTAIDTLARRASKRGDRTLDILLLSGGGQHGAYGIGFMRGWLARVDAPMPTFDMVTGVSTGSLQAPYALVGTATAIDTAADLYRKSATQFAPTPDYLSWLRLTGGVVNTERFRAAIARSMDETMAGDIAKVANDDRQLLVATTDFDLGVGRAWNLSTELARAPDGLERTREILVASCAIPGIFPPVILDHHVHTDGGVIANALFPFELKHFERLAQRLRDAGVSGTVRIRVWIIVNFWTHPRIVAIDPANRSQISQRSTIMMFTSQQPQFLDRIDLLARTVSARVPGLQMEMRFTAIPDEYSTAPGVSRLFDEAWMQRVEAIGYTRAQSASPWDRIVSPYERPGRE